MATVKKKFSSTISTSENYVEGWLINYQQSKKYKGSRKRNFVPFTWKKDCLPLSQTRTIKSKNNWSKHCGYFLILKNTSEMNVKNIFWLLRPQCFIRQKFYNASHLISITTTTTKKIKFFKCVRQYMLLLMNFMRIFLVVCAKNMRIFNWIRSKMVIPEDLSSKLFFYKLQKYLAFHVYVTRDDN